MADVLLSESGAAILEKWRIVLPGRRFGGEHRFGIMMKGPFTANQH